MKILLDTNIIVDFLLDRKPFSLEAEEIIRKAGESYFESVLTANAITDIYFIIRKSLTDSQARTALIDLLEFMRILSVNEKDCKLALVSENPDFEDALMEVCSHKENVNYIITRDEQFLKVCKIAISPINFLKLLK